MYSCVSICINVYVCVFMCICVHSLSYNLFVCVKVYLRYMCIYVYLYLCALKCNCAYWYMLLRICEYSYVFLCNYSLTERSFERFMLSYKGSARWCTLSGSPGRVPLVPPDLQFPEIPPKFQLRISFKFRC